MIAFDTNLLVRVAVADDAKQVAVVRQLIAQNTIFISRTVLLETEWVLRSVYKNTSADIHRFFQALLNLDNTEIENAEAISHALTWYAHGADFADALHLAVCKDATLHTFDKSFCKAALEAGLAPQITILSTSTGAD